VQVQPGIQTMSRQQQSHDRWTDVTHGTSDSAAPPDISAQAGTVASALQPLWESISGGHGSTSCQSSSERTGHGHTELGQGVSASPS